MNFDLFFLCNSSLHKKLRRVLALISLQLDHLTQLWILHDRPIATELFLEILQDPVVIEVFLQSLHCRQTFPAIALLNPDVDAVFGPGARRIRVGCFFEWIVGGRDLNLQI